MTTTNQEQASLVERILSTKPFINAGKRRKLLIYLYENRDRFIGGKEISHEVLGTPATKDEYMYDAGRVRERCMDLRDALKRYAESASDRWICELPEGTRGEGYRLEFRPRNSMVSATEAFWAPHLESPEDIVVICGDHLFFFDPSQNTVFRVYDLNIDGDKDEIRSALKSAYPKLHRQNLEPSHNFYLSTGEVHAYEILQKWIYHKSGVLVPRFTGREVHPGKIHRSSPVLLGRPATNRFMKSILDSPQAEHLAYRVHTSIGAVHISNPTPEEAERLSKRFPFSREGTLGPVPNWESAFGIVSRLPNPGGYSAVTIISYHYYAKVVTQIIEELTNEKLASLLLHQMNWEPGDRLPESFEMLFSVKLAPGNIEGEGRAELLLWRGYPKTKYEKMAAHKR